MQHSPDSAALHLLPLFSFRTLLKPEACHLVEAGFQSGFERASLARLVSACLSWPLAGMLNEQGFTRGWLCLPNRAPSTLQTLSTETHSAAVPAASASAESFRNVYVSLLTLTQIVSHCFADGSDTEACGLLWGFVPPGANHQVVVIDDASTITDRTQGAPTIPLPNVRSPGQFSVHSPYGEHAAHASLKNVGWYRTHPGYGCWLTRVEQAGQAAGQEIQEPWISIIVDPLQSRRIGQVALRAFRVYPQGFQPPMHRRRRPAPATEWIPLNKLDEYNQGASSYYELKVHYYGTGADASLHSWMKQHDWPCILSASDMAAGRASMARSLMDLQHKTEAVEVALRQLIRSRLYSNVTDESAREISARHRTVSGAVHEEAFLAEEECQTGNPSGSMHAASSRQTSLLPPVSPSRGHRVPQRRWSELDAQRGIAKSAASANVAERMERLLADARTLHAAYARMLLQEALKQTLFPRHS